MVESSHTIPIIIKDIEEMEACGIIREIVNGQWVDASEEKMAGEWHVAIAANLIIALGSYVKAHQLGCVYPADTTYILPVMRYCQGLHYQWQRSLRYKLSIDSAPLDKGTP